MTHLTLMQMAYLAVVVIFLIPTTLEQRRRQSGYIWRLLGMLLCLVWPITLLVTIFWDDEQQSDGKERNAHPTGRTSPPMKLWSSM